MAHVNCTVQVLAPDEMVHEDGEAETEPEAEAVVVNVPSVEYPVPVELVA